MQTEITNTPWLDALTRSTPVARRGDDGEGVHQLRVAAGRLEVWLRMAGWSVLIDDLRWLRAYAAAVRDLDVVLQANLPDDLAAWLRERRQEERARLASALDDPRLEALTAALRWLPPLPRRAALAYQRQQRGVVMRAGRRIRTPKAPVDDVHRLRRAVRRLRYALEWTESPARPVQELQEALGDFNDTAVAMRILAGFPDRASVTEQRRVLARRLDEQRKAAFAAWRATAPKLRGKRVAR
jgi:CHAD domain-containing protein